MTPLSFKSLVDDEQIKYYIWKPNSDTIKGVIQIAHGLAEHSYRYKEFAEFLNKNGYVVVANDHRGHGRTYGLENMAYYLKAPFWDAAISDMLQFSNLIKKEYQDTPFFLFGHSMGSLLARGLIAQNEFNYQGIILSATAGNPGMLGRLGVVIATILSWFAKNKPSNLIHRLTFGKYNEEFKPVTTDFDWLNRDAQEVKKYIDDPFCGSVFSNAFWRSFLKGVLKVNSNKHFKAVSKDNSILLLGGDKDPVGQNGKGVQEVFNKYKAQNIKFTQILLYKDARHELVHEQNKEEVKNDIINWLNDRVSE